MAAGSGPRRCRAVRGPLWGKVGTSRPSVSEASPTCRRQEVGGAGRTQPVSGHVAGPACWGPGQPARSERGMVHGTDGLPLAQVSGDRREPGCQGTEGTSRDRTAAAGPREEPDLSPEDTWGQPGRSGRVSGDSDVTVRFAVERLDTQPQSDDFLPDFPFKTCQRSGRRGEHKTGSAKCQTPGPARPTHAVVSVGV